MMHPSYPEMIAIANSEVQDDESPIVQSRYSIVTAAAKRARQLVDGDEATVQVLGPEDKPLSIAVRELYSANVRILRRRNELAEEIIEPEREVVRDI